MSARVAIISGAGKGLGRAYALALAAQGVAVVVNNRRHAGDALPSADAVVEEIRRAGGEAVADYGAAEDPETGESLLRLARERFGRLDIVIANAGVSEAASFCKQDAASFAHNLHINLLGTAYLLLPTFKHLYAQGSGHVVLSSSAAGLYGEHGLPAYSAAKAGLLGLMYSLAQEGRPHQVYVNAIAPFADTQMTRETLAAASVSGLEPERVAPILTALVSPACKISGETIIAGGGRLARAAMHTSRSSSAGVDATQALLALMEAPTEQVHRSAVSLFKTFIAPE